MSRRQLVPITPTVLQWAIHESGYSDESLSHEIGVDHAELKEWLEGKSQPSKTQFDALVGKLKRPTAIFFLPEAPKSLAPQVQFRRPPGDRTRPNPRELRLLRAAARVQSTASWAIRELEILQTPIPLIPPRLPVEEAALQVRSFLNADQVSRSGTDAQVQTRWRASIEAKGVFVFLLPLGKKSVRGFSLYDDTAPLLAVNTHWDYRPRIFSMLHELSHLVSRTSSACSESFQSRLPDQDDPIERWCEGVAAAALLPWMELDDFLHTRLGLRRAAHVESTQQLFKIANHFKTSARATALRLIWKDRASWNLFHAIPPANENKAQGGGGGGRNRAEIREDEYGEPVLRVFARAVDQGLLTQEDASGYLRVADTDLSAWQ